VSREGKRARSVGARSTATATAKAGTWAEESEKDVNRKDVECSVVLLAASRARSTRNCAAVSVGWIKS